MKTKTVRTTSLIVLALLAALLLPLPGRSAVHAGGNAYSRNDLFSGEALHPLWSWVNEDPATWSLTDNPGHLRIIPAPGPSGTRNLLLTPVTDTKFQNRTHLLFEPTANFQIAGLVIWQDAGNYLQFGRAYCDPALPACVGNGIYFDQVRDGSFYGRNFATQTAGQGQAYLRLERTGNRIKAFYSENGADWTPIGAHRVQDGFQIVGVGLTAAQDLSELGTPADFDDFMLNAGFPPFDLLGSDGFAQPVLSPPWYWVNEEPSAWSLTDHPGYLRIVTSPFPVSGQNLLLQPAPAGDLLAATRVLFTPTHNFQIASLVLYQDPDNYLQLGRAYCDPGFPVCVGNGIYFDLVENGLGVGSNFATHPGNPGEAFLRLVREGERYWAFFSDDGSTWRLIGVHTPGTAFVPSAMGLTAAQDYDNIGVPADFDYFKYYHSP